MELVVALVMGLESAHRNNHQSMRQRWVALRLATSNYIRSPARNWIFSSVSVCGQRVVYGTYYEYVYHKHARVQHVNIVRGGQSIKGDPSTLVVGEIDNCGGHRLDRR
jgi:hypothetical protein